MTQRTRILIGLAILIVLVATILGIDALQRASGSPAQATEDEPTLVPGSIPIYLDGQLVGGFSPADLDQLEKVSFVEPEEGKKQEGWMLRDVILLHVDGERLEADSLITVSSSSRNKSAQLTWAEVNEPANMVVFDLSNRGTLQAGVSAGETGHAGRVGARYGQDRDHQSMTVKALKGDR